MGPFPRWFLKKICVSCLERHPVVYNRWSKETLLLPHPRYKISYLKQSRFQRFHGYLLILGPCFWSSDLQEIHVIITHQFPAGPYLPLPDWFCGWLSSKFSTKSKFLTLRLHNANVHLKSLGGRYKQFSSKYLTLNRDRGVNIKSFSETDILVGIIFVSLETCS